MTELEVLQYKAKIAVGRASLWDYCRIKNPLFYTSKKEYLKDLANTLQDFYEGKLIKEDGTKFTKLMINMPPRFGKSRTLINLCQWVLGKNEEERIIECSYNDTTASEFSKYTRDGIDEKKNDDAYFVFSDFFLKTLFIQICECWIVTKLRLK